MVPTNFQKQEIEDEMVMSYFKDEANFKDIAKKKFISYWNLQSKKRKGDLNEKLINLMDKEVKEIFDRTLRGNAYSYIKIETTLNKKKFGKKITG